MWLYFPLKRRKFDGFLGFFAGSENPSERVANLAFDQTNSFFRLFVFCSFAPSPQKYKSIFWGPLPLENSENFIININLKKSEFWCDYTSPIKRREFDGFLGFFAGFENPSVLSVHEFSGSAKTPKRRELSPFYKKNFGRAHVCSPRRLPEIISKCYDCGNAACW